MDHDMQRLDRQLGARVRRERKVGLTIRRAYSDDAGSLARRHGYELHVREIEEPGCVWAEFWPIAGRPS